MSQLFTQWRNYKMYWSQSIFYLIDLEDHAKLLGKTLEFSYCGHKKTKRKRRKKNCTGPHETLQKRLLSQTDICCICKFVLDFTVVICAVVTMLLFYRNGLTCELRWSLKIKYENKKLSYWAL